MKKGMIGLGIIFLLMSMVACYSSPGGGAASAQRAPAPAAAPDYGSAPAPAETNSNATTSTAATLKLSHNDKLGDVLTDTKGMTLYLFTKDQGTTSVCYDACEQKWPALHTDGAPMALQGLDSSLLGTTERKDGTMQVTYNGHPLYYYYTDMNPGDTTGQGVGSVWFVLSPAGDAIE